MNKYWQREKKTSGPSTSSICPLFKLDILFLSLLTFHSGAAFIPSFLHQLPFFHLPPSCPPPLPNFNTTSSSSSSSISAASGLLWSQRDTNEWGPQEGRSCSATHHSLSLSLSLLPSIAHTHTHTCRDTHTKMGPASLCPMQALPPGCHGNLQSVSPLMPDCVELVRYGWSPGWVKLCCSLPCRATPCQVNQLHNLGCNVSSPSSFFCLAGIVCLFHNLQYVLNSIFFLRYFFTRRSRRKQKKFPTRCRCRRAVDSHVLPAWQMVSSRFFSPVRFELHLQTGQEHW